MMLSPGVTHLGRAEDNDLVLTDIGVSRRHARILVHTKGTYIEDMGSGNGMYFRGRRVQRQQLEDGDEVLVDPFILSFRLHQVETEDDGVTAELEDVDDDDTVRVGLRASGAPPTEERPMVMARARLVTLAGQRLDGFYDMAGNGLTMGRNESRDIVLYDPAASRNHAIVERKGNDFWLRDNGSANGTYVNASRVREQCLRNGDKVRIGTTEFRFERQNPVPGAAARAAALDAPSRGTRSPGAPPLRGAKAPSSAGNRAVSPRGMPPRKSLVSGVQMAVLAGLAGFIIVAMMIVGGIIALSVVESDFGWGSSASDGVTEQEFGTQYDPSTASRIDQLLDRGMVHFDAGRYLDAAAQYYSVLKLSPGHRVAQRMGYRACEQQLIDSMRTGLVLRNLPEDEQEARRTKALRLARLTLRGRGDVDRAIRRLRRVRVFRPDDDEVAEVLARIESMGTGTE
jgi:pSer/pThr/pTyr-binding forkhead associated (FHA) protein